jgi:hypothetical protein
MSHIAGQAPKENSLERSLNQRGLKYPYSFKKTSFQIVKLIHPNA